MFCLKWIYFQMVVWTISVWIIKPGWQNQYFFHTFLITNIPVCSLQKCYIQVCDDFQTVGQMWSFFGNTWSAFRDLKQNLIPFSEAPHLIWTKNICFCWLTLLRYYRTCSIKWKSVGARLCHLRKYETRLWGNLRNSEISVLLPLAFLGQKYMW